MHNRCHVPGSPPARCPVPLPRSLTPLFSWHSRIARAAMPAAYLALPVPILFLAIRPNHGFGSWSVIRASSVTVGPSRLSHKAAVRSVRVRESPQGRKRALGFTVIQSTWPHFSRAKVGRFCRAPRVFCGHICASACPKKRTAATTYSVLDRLHEEGFSDLLSVSATIEPCLDAAARSFRIRHKVSASAATSAGLRLMASVSDLFSQSDEVGSAETLRAS